MPTRVALVAPASRHDQSLAVTSRPSAGLSGDPPAAPAPASQLVHLRQLVHDHRGRPERFERPRAERGKASTGPSICSSGGGKHFLRAGTVFRINKDHSAHRCYSHRIDSNRTAVHVPCRPAKCKKNMAPGTLRREPDQERSDEDVLHRVFLFFSDDADMPAGDVIGKPGIRVKSPTARLGHSLATSLRAPPPDGAFANRNGDRLRWRVRTRQPVVHASNASAIASSQHRAAGERHRPAGGEPPGRH